MRYPLCKDFMTCQKLTASINAAEQNSLMVVIDKTCQDCETYTKPITGWKWEMPTKGGS